MQHIWHCCIRHQIGGYRASASFTLTSRSAPPPANCKSESRTGQEEPLSDKPQNRSVQSYQRITLSNPLHPWRKILFRLGNICISRNNRTPLKRTESKYRLMCTYHPREACREVGQITFQIQGIAFPHPWIVICFTELASECSCHPSKFNPLLKRTLYSYYYPTLYSHCNTDSHNKGIKRINTPLPVFRWNIATFHSSTQACGTLKSRRKTPISQDSSHPEQVAQMLNIAYRWRSIAINA